MKFEFRDNGLNPNAPLLYRVLIDSRPVYIGCADKAERPKKAYARNVAKMKSGLPYRKNNPTGFRAIHHRLFAASQKGEEIVIELLKNVLKSEKFIEESEEIARHRQLPGVVLLNGATAPIRKQEPNQSPAPAAPGGRASS